jgi:spore coat protein U-like protein
MKNVLDHFKTTLVLSTLLAMAATVNHAHADSSQCTFSNPSASLATLPSPNVYNSGTQGQISAGMSCTMLSINLLTSDDILATLTQTTHNFQLVNSDGSGDSVPYSVFADQNYMHQMTVGSTIDYRQLNILSLVIGTGTRNIPLYVKVLPGANVRAGTYSDTISIYWDYDLCALLGLLGLCASPVKGTGTSTITINLIVTKSCVINSAPNVNLGSNSFVSQFNPVTQTINITCTKTEGYKSYFSNGANYSSPWRRLRSSAGNYLQYHIYLPNTTTVWDSNNKQSGVGTGFSSNINFQAALNPAQSEQAAGSYTDTVTFTVEY